MVHYGMVIDTKACIACQACHVACKMENSTQQGVLWTHVVQEESGKYPNTIRAVMPVLCNHCENAPCVDVCPTGASYRRPDGIVMIDANKCIGCRYCVQACPYGARTYIAEFTSYYPSRGPTLLEKFGYTKHKVGVVEKCTFCTQRIDQGIKDGFKPGVDPEATPACVTTCIAYARTFGDLDDPTSAVARVIAERQATPLKAYLGTKPSVYYIGYKIGEQ
jgi:Fe-S-cluster-containing dehydrogenase component